MMDKAKGLHTHKPYYYNRELSWLKFNERVLDEAIDKEVPLCERLSLYRFFRVIWTNSSWCEWEH